MAAGSLPGQVGLRPPLRLSGTSVVFLTVSGLSRRQPLLLLPGCSGQAPCAIAGHDVSQKPDGRSGGESEVAIGASVGAPFIESEQLGSHVRLPGLHVETGQPHVKQPSAITWWRTARPGYRLAGASHRARSGHALARPLRSLSPRVGGRPWPGGRPCRHRAGRSPGACRSACVPERSPAPAWPGRPGSTATTARG